LSENFTVDIMHGMLEGVYKYNIIIILIGDNCNSLSPPIDHSNGKANMIRHDSGDVT